jgi:hypothetical protein
VTADDSAAPPKPGDDQIRFQRAADSLPKLTRAVLRLSAIDDMPYGDISLRCGISEDEVRVRLADSLIALGRAMRGPLPWTGRVGLALRPLRSMWARARARESDRRLARWLPQSFDALRRSPLDHVARL